MGNESTERIVLAPIGASYLAAPEGEGIYFLYNQHATLRVSDNAKFSG